jgi:formylmethanofuran dehydrogenase subunit A
MESKNIVQYIILAVVIFISITGLINLTKVSTNIREARRTMDSVMYVVKDSKKIIEQQSRTIDTLQKLNTTLYQKVQVTDSLNKVIKWTIDTKFSTTTKSLRNIKQELDNIQIPDIH